MMLTRHATRAEFLQSPTKSLALNSSYWLQATIEVAAVEVVSLTTSVAILLTNKRT